MGVLEKVSHLQGPGAILGARDLVNKSRERIYHLLALQCAALGRLPSQGDVERQSSTRLWPQRIHFLTVQSPSFFICKTGQ